MSNKWVCDLFVSFEFKKRHQEWQPTCEGCLFYMRFLTQVCKCCILLAAWVVAGGWSVDSSDPQIHVPQFIYRGVGAPPSVV